MKTTSLVLYRGNGFDSQSTPRRFVKDVLRVGRWIHPVTKQEVVITAERMRKLVANTEQYRQTLDRKAIPFQDGHNFDAKKTLGWWSRFWIQGDRLFGEVDVTDQEAAKKISEGSIRSVSARIDPQLGDTDGKVYDEGFTHVCATPLAVLDGQNNFEALSREVDPVQLYVELAGIVPEKEKTMDPKKLAVLLGLPETDDQEQIEEAAKKAATAGKISLDQVKADAVKAMTTELAASLKEFGVEIKDGKPVKLAAPPPSDETPREKALREEVESLKAAGNLSRLQVIKEKIEGAAKEFSITPGLVPAFTELASIQSDVQALCLSADGANVQKKAVNAFGRVMEIIKGLPKLNASVLTQLSAQETDEQKKVDKAADAKAAELLARNTGAVEGDEKE